MAAAAKDVGQAAAAAPAKKGMSLVTVLLVVVVALGIGGGGAYFFVAKGASAEAGDDAPAKGKKGAKGKAKAPAVPATYIPIEPAFVVNLADEDSLRYLQLEVQVATRDKAAEDAIKQHMPVIRNNLLMLFAQQRTYDLRDRGGKERLQKAALDEVKKVVKAEGGDGDLIEALYFTSFVTQ